jgi:NADH/NAD ratio-sensing transcriptional regulator Rex
MGGYRASDWPEDYDFVLRAHAQGARFGKPEGKALLRWRDHERRLSRNDAHYNRRAFLECKAFYLSQYLNEYDLWPVAIWGAGPTGLKLHDYLESFGVEVTHFYDINPKLANRTKRGKKVYVAELPVTGKFFQSIKQPLLIAINIRGAAQEMAGLCCDAGLKPFKDFIQVA